VKQSRRQQIKNNLKGGQGKGRGRHPGNSSFTEPLTPKQAHHIAASETRSEYAPAIRAAKQEAAGSGARQQQIGEWFGGLGDQINQAAQATDASYGQANAALLAHMQAAQNAAQATQGQIVQGNAATAQLTGADPSLFQKTNAEGAAAANQRAMTESALAAPIAQAGASQAAYLRNTGINAGRESIQQRGLESKRRQKIKEDLTALRKERAQKTVGNFNELRNQERDYGIQLRAFPQKEKEMAQDAREGAATRRLDEEQFHETQRHNRAGEHNTAVDNQRAERERREQKKHGGLTPSEQRDRQEGRQNAWAQANALYRSEPPPKSSAEWAKFQAHLAQEEGISPQEAQWAVKRLRRKVSGSSNKVSGWGDTPWS
jgi:hypothetical protein